MSFFRRLKIGFPIAYVDYKLSFIPLFSLLAIFAIGYNLYGKEILSISHWSKMHGIFISPYIGIPCLAIISIYIIFISIDILLCKGWYLSSDGIHIFVKLRKKIYLKDVDIDSIKIAGLQKNIIHLNEGGKLITIPMIYGKISSKRAASKIVEIMREMREF